MYNTAPETDDLATVARRTRRHQIILVGDPEIKQLGLVDRVDASEKLIRELIQTKREITVRIEMLIAVVALLGLTQFNDFIKLIQALFGAGTSP